jgi:hypothetical protein
MSPVAGWEWRASRAIPFHRALSLVTAALLHKPESGRALVESRSWTAAGAML